MKVGKERDVDMQGYSINEALQMKLETLHKLNESIRLSNVGNFFPSSLTIFWNDYVICGIIQNWELYKEKGFLELSFSNQMISKDISALISLINKKKSLFERYIRIIYFMIL